jgi:hypothetical protein
LDGVLLTSAGEKHVSAIGGTTTARGTGWSSGMSAAVQKNNSKYAVVKYVSSESPVGESQAKTAKPEPIVEVVRSDLPQPGASDTAPATPVVK